jgi:hypothetical protein
MYCSFSYVSRQLTTSKISINARISFGSCPTITSRDNKTFIYSYVCWVAGQKTTLHDAEMKKKMIPSVVFEVADYKVCSVRFL